MDLTIDIIKKGMVLQSDVYDDAGTLVLSAGTVLSDALIGKLKAKHIEQISVIKDQSVLDNVPIIAVDENVRKAYLETVEQYKELFTSLKKGHKVAYEEVESVTEPILNEVIKNSSVVRQVWRLRTFDNYTFDHSVGVSIFSALLAKWLNYSPSMIKRAAIAGLVHDVGKIKLPDDILNKQTALTDAEYEVMKLHPLLGYNLLRDSSSMPDVILEAVLHHHERYDGSGFPHGLVGENIPPLTRVVSIGDIFSAMINHRVYAETLNPYKAAQNILDMSYNELDPYMAQLFVRGISNYYIGNVVKLTSGEVGEIVLVNQAELERPLVKTENTFVDLSKERDIKIEEIIY